MSDGADLEFNFEHLRFIELRGDGDKRPSHSWGGYSPARGDLADRPHVHTHEDVLAHPAREWGVVDVVDKPHRPLSTLTFDLDTHKAPEDFDPADLEIRGDVPIVRTQSGGFYVGPFLVHAPRGDGAESDFELVADVEWDVDIRGSFVKQHHAAPNSIPGVGGDYELLNDARMPGVFDPADATARITYQGESLVEYNPDTGVGDFDFDRPTEAPDEMPTCYHAGLELRKAAPSDHPNTHKVNVLTALCGLAAGYDVETVAEHFCGEWAPRESGTDHSDVRETEYQVEHLARKLDSGEYSPPALSTLREWGILDENEGCDCSIDYHTTRSTSDRGQVREQALSAGPHAEFPIETCRPPAIEAEPFDTEAVWDDLQGDRLDETLEADGPVIWADDAGSGKTTNSVLGALDRDLETAPLLDKHEKARELITDDALPETWDPFHLKGGGQPLHDCCLDARIAAPDDRVPECPTHGHAGEWDHMCPIYDLDPDDEDRKRYEALAREVGDVRAHLILDDQLPGHDEDGRGPWIEQFEAVEAYEHVVGVHEYQLLKTVRGTPDDDRLVIVDETPRSLREQRHVTVEDVARASNALAAIADLPSSPDTLDEFARFARDLTDALVDPERATLEDVDPPAITGETIRVTVDPDDLPDDVDPDDVQVGTTRDTVDPIANAYVEREQYYVERDLLAESLAKCKIAYNETVVARIRRGEWSGAPLVFDALLAAAASAGLEADAARQAIALDSLLDQCPWCHSEVGFDNGARCCSDDSCDWHEEHHHITQRDGRRARARGWIDTDPGPGGQVALVFEQLPHPDDLPDRPVVLDATATPSKVAALYGVDPADVTVLGAQAREANMHVTQVLDGQYHAQTIRDSETVRERVQARIDQAGKLFTAPLFVLKKGLISLFEFPEHATVRHFHGLRGLNHNECDYVGVIGAPHPDVADLEREAELLAIGRDDLRVGGTEHSTRRDNGDLAANPPVYRKLWFEDDDGEGRAVPTKHYTGLVGDLFQEAHSDEIVQAVHRARPLTSETTVHVDLMTNVPTNLHVDEVCTFRDLADPLVAMLPVADGAIQLLEAVRDVVAGDGPEGFRPEALVEFPGDGSIANKPKGYHRLARLSGLDVTQRTIYNWIDDLEALGLLSPESYEQRGGVSYTADLATLQEALSFLSDNVSFKVAAVQRFRELVAEADGSLDWLEWARDTIALRGAVNGGGSPPHDAG